MIKNFVDKEYALEINQALVALERKSKKEFYRIGGYIQAKAENEGEFSLDRRKAERRVPDPGMASDGQERRGGKDRRKVSGGHK